MIKVITFRLDEAYLEKLDRLAGKLGLEDRSQVIRLALDEIIEKYLNLEGSLVVIEKTKWDAIFNMLSNLLMKDILPHIRKTQEESRQKITNEIIKLVKEGKLEIEKP